MREMRKGEVRDEELGMREGEKLGEKEEGDEVRNEGMRILYEELGMKRK